MVSTKFYLDTRSTKGKDAPAPVKLVITKKGTTSLISTGIKVTQEQWDAKKQLVVNKDNERKLNYFLSKFKIRVENIIIDAEAENALVGMNASRIKDYILTVLSPNSEEEEKESHKDNFIELYKRFALLKKGRTREIYDTTLKRIKEFDPECESLTFSEVDKNWLIKFDIHLSKSSPSRNARNIHFRNIRAVFNYAIEEEITSLYPFRKFKIKNEPTIKRALTVNQLREIAMCNPWGVYAEYRDIFMLIFFLWGINLKDLFNLTSDNIRNGRLEYIRAKTGKFYSVKLEPEALEIIQRYRGEKFLLNLHDRYKNHKDYMKHLNRGLSMIGNVVGKSKNGLPVMKPICPSLTTYWARHSWATIAAELDIPKETIAAGLGHEIGSPITAIYIDFNIKKVDKANRKMIDYILS